jgi:TPR repeat protein
MRVLVMLGVLALAGCAGPTVSHRDDAPALRELKHRCAARADKACVELGIRYASGTEVRQSYPYAHELFERACAHEVASGCNSLGVLYMKGQGVAKDPTRALVLYESGCAGGPEWPTSRDRRRRMLRRGR